MTLEERFNSLKEALTGKSAEVESKVAEVTALNTKLAELNDLVTAKEVSITELTAKVSEASEKLALADKLISEMKLAQESAGKKAAKIAASVGVEPVEINPAVASNQAKTDEELATEWASLKQKDTKAASEFYTKHRTAILRHAGL